MRAHERLGTAPDHRADRDAGRPTSAVLRLQRSAGNAAVAGALQRASRTDVASRDAAGAAGPSPVESLAAKAGSPSGLRAMLAANPGLAHQVVAWFAAGHVDEALNAMLGQAFSPATAGQQQAPSGGQSGTGTSAEPGSADGGAPEKAPKDPTLPLPPALTGTKTLLKGDLTWSLAPANHQSARIDLDFKPDATKVDAKTVSYGQTVINKIGSDLAYAGGSEADPARNKAKFQPFEDPTSKHRIDHLVDSENDPFYGAEWNQTTKSWANESPGRVVGASSTKTGVSTSATMDDTPEAPSPRTGKGDSELSFESVPMVLETREPLGAILWGFKIEDKENAPIVLTGAKDADVTDTPSAAWGATMDQYYAGKYAEILDDFDIGKSDLKDAHKTQLDSVVTKLQGNAALRAQLGGAADLTGSAKLNMALSLKRAENARDYLVSKGIDAARLEVQSYGADWARVETSTGASESKNRRVQVWVH
ncbi:OmpA family protein [Nakamurella sp.]|uniref:OmpA family protein n=1 Tax=Nakamurella sp. TaxID=1869182 RepID=UPI0037837DF6